MKRFGILFLVLALLCLTACHAGPAAGTPVPQSERSAPAEQPEEQQPEEPKLPKEPEPAAADAGTEGNGARDAMLACYRHVLERVLNEQVYPDGSDCLYDGAGDLSDNMFAVTDIDGDGGEELIVSFTTTCVASMTERIYSYDAAEDTVTEEAMLFPGMLSYYDSGLVECGWSHNMGYAGESFWPYDLLRYVPETDTYRLLACVDAWDRNMMEANFPEDVDTDGAGIVFYIMEGGYDDTTAPVSKSDYEAWRAAQFGQAEKQTVLYQRLTEENIEAACGA